MADKKSFVLYCDYRKHFSLLSPEEQGCLIMAIFEYVETGAEPVLEAMPLMAFSFIRAQLDRDFASYAETCKRRAEAGRRSGEARRAKAEAAEQEGTKRTDNDTVNVNETVNETVIYNRGNSDESPQKKTASRFIPPTIEDVRAYCIERGNGVNPESFVDFYASKGWMVGKNKMKDWKAAIRTWEKGESRQAQPRRPSASKAYSNPALDYYHQLMAEEQVEGGGQIDIT